LNIVFWLIAAAMVLLALLIVLPPLWRKHDNAIDDDLDQRNIKIARDRLAELKANKAAGGISQAQYNEQVVELELALSDDLDLANTPAKVQTQGRWLAFALAFAIPVLAASLYWVLGNHQALSYVNDPEQAAQTNQSNPEMPSPEAVNNMVAKLAVKLKTEPNNLEGWLMLGRSYKVLKRYPEATEAYARAYQLAGDKPDVMLPYAEALALSKNGDWVGKPKELVTKALSVDPENLTGLWFAAMATAQQGDKPNAVSYLKKLEKALPADSPDKQQIHEIIANVESPSSSKVSPDTQNQTNAKTTIAVDVTVSLAKELQQYASPKDTVFIYAQALSGPKVPLAIVRKSAEELPIAVSLTDANSMMPSIKLSNFQQVRLLARISKADSAMPQSGDLIGVIEQVDLADRQPHKIVINDRIK
jgi:cytochrome c-type biogenesis protein CcmH